MTSINTQSNLFDQPRPGSNMPEYGVTEISRLLKKTVEETFGLVRVRGEISECKYHSNGHVYMTLKDEGAILAAVCWRGQVGKLGIRPEIGMEVVCIGRLTTYAGQSKYQMVIDGMALAGVGALLKMLEERKKKLASEGLFDPARKQELPFLPEVIGVVTSPTGAVIRDILHRLDERFPRRVLIWPVAVQGQGAAEQIAAAIEGFNALDETGNVPRPDVIIVARGGGSVEDLMPFNEEIVVRAAAASQIALISAVGHETDTTLIDFAADKRAPTPTAAAEMAVPVRADLIAQVGDEGMRLFGGIRRIVQDLRERLSLTERALGDPARVIEPLMQRLDERTERMMLAWDGDFGRREARLAEAKGKLRHPRDVIAMKLQSFEERSARLELNWSSFIERRDARIIEIAARIRHPREQLALAQQKLQNTEPRLKTALRENLQRWRHGVEKHATALDHLSPKAVMGRGYALIRTAENRVVTSVASITKGDRLNIELHDGTKSAVADE